VLGLVRREAEEDLGHDVVDQRQRRAWRRHGACARGRRRRRGFGWGFGLGEESERDSHEMGWVRP
jgi:hypothetical protein